MTTDGRDAGETLIELLVAIAILGTSVIAILGGILVVEESSSMHRKQAQAQNGLRSWAEQVSTAPYVNCALASGFSPPSPSLPSGFTPTVAAVRYWNGTSFANSCGSDTGIQKVTLQIVVASGLYPGFTQRLDLVLRKPCVSSC
jgi:hypothetical protein